MGILGLSHFSCRERGKSKNNKISSKLLEQHATIILEEYRTPHFIFQPPKNG